MGQHRHDVSTAVTQGPRNIVQWSRARLRGTGVRCAQCIAEARQAVPVRVVPLLGFSVVKEVLGDLQVLGCEWKRGAASAVSVSEVCLVETGVLHR